MLAAAVKNELISHYLVRVTTKVNTGSSGNESGSIVNYAFRFSGPATALTARRLRHGVGAGLICQPDHRPAMKNGLPHKDIEIIDLTDSDEVSI
jgi:hypothetical protein